jgi:integrase
MKTTIKGLQRVRSKGRVYLYHRPTKTRLVSVEGSPEFFAELAAIAKKKPGIAAAGTLGALIAAYKASSKFSTRAMRTKADYEKVFDYLKPLSGMPMDEFDSAEAFAIQEKAFRKRKRRFANYVVAVLKLLCNWGKPRKLCGSNPLEGVQLIARAKNAPIVNRPWTDDEIEKVIYHAPVSIKTAVLIALCTSLREGDVIRLPWSAYNGTRIKTKHAKNGQWLEAPAHPLLKTCLDTLPTRPKSEAEREKPIVLGDRSGKPFGDNGFRSRFGKFIAQLEKKKIVGEGLTFHGLRHSVATRLAEAGCTPQEIMTITGHLDEKMVKLYTATADKKKWAAKAISMLNLPKPTGQGELL